MEKGADGEIITHKEEEVSPLFIDTERNGVPLEVKKAVVVAKTTRYFYVGGWT